MNQIMEKLSVLEHAGPGHPPPPPWAPPGGQQGWGEEGYGPRPRGLEELTQLRLAQLDELQRQQRELQVRIIFTLPTYRPYAYDIIISLRPHLGDPYRITRKRS